MAAVLVGGAFLSAFLRVVFDLLDSPQVSNYFRGRNLGEKLLKLRSIEGAVDDAELKVRDPRVRDWLYKVIDAVFDAEDLLDKIQIEALKCELEAGSRASSSEENGESSEVQMFYHEFWFESFGGFIFL